MDAYPTTHPMSNGATVADWLGTAKTAAEVAAFLIERVRSNVSLIPTVTLTSAEKRLIQALDELRAVRAEVEH